MGRDLMMPAAVYVGGGRLAVTEVPVPEPGPGELLIEVSACGICGSDLHLVLEQYARPGAVLGHEWAGRVVAGGPLDSPSDDPSERPLRGPTAPSGGARDRHPGDRVVFEPTPGCGRCRPCRRGRPSVCVDRPISDMRDMRGAFARYVTVPSANLLTIPDSLDLRSAALAEPTAIALHAVELAAVTSEDRVLVTGGGPVGLLIIAVLRARGVADISVSEPVALRRDRAMAIGARTAFTPDDFVEPDIGRTVERPFAVVFECSGRASAAEQALGQLDFAGTLVFVGTGATPTRVNHNRMIILELEAIGTYNYGAAGFRPAVDVLASGELPVDLLLEDDDVPLSGVMNAMEELSRGELAAKVLVRPKVS